MRFFNKTTARALLIVAALLGAAWLASLDFGKKISTDVLDLIPKNERAPELAVVRSLAGEKQSRVALFALRVAGDDEMRESAARAFIGALLASNAFAEAEIHGDTTSRNALGKHIFDQRLELLLPGWLAKNKGLSGAALAERAAAELEKFMSKSEALAFAEITGADPLLLLPSLVEKMQGIDAGSSASGALADTALIWALTRDNPLAPAGQQPVFDAVDAAHAAARAIAPGASLRWTGISRFAAESRASIMHELLFGTLLTFAAVLGVAVICLPRILGTLNLVPVIVGALLGACVAVTLCFERVHVLVFVLGLMLAGVSIDYGFYLYLQPQKIPGEPYSAKVRRLMKPLLGSALTTVLGFSLLLFSDLPLIRQLGVFVSAGLLCALATAVLWFAQIKNPNMSTRAFVNAQARPGPRARRAVFAILALGAAVALAGPWRLHWRDSTQELQPRLPRLVRDATELRSYFGESDARTVYLTRGATAAEARDNLEKFSAWHAAQFPGAGAASLGYALPLRADYDALPARLAQLRDFPAELHAALVRHGFNAGEFAPFFTAWNAFVGAHLACALAPEEPAASAISSASAPEGAREARPYDEIIANLAASLRGQTSLLMSVSPGSCFFMTVAEHAPSTDEPPAALATVSLNQLESLNRLFGRYRVSALRLSIIGLALVGLSMWAIYGVKRGSLIFTTPVGSCLFVFGLFGLCGATLNLFHLLGAFLGVCLSHNYAIFTAENDARREQPPPSIRLSALSTAASFGVLACSGIPVVSALGVTVMLIVLAALCVVELKRAAKSRNTA